MANQDVELLPLSALNHHAYCPRRCYLIHAEGEFKENVHTIRGTLEHERVDQMCHEVSAGVRVEYGLPVWSYRLGLNGRCDAVEFHPDGSVYPVEYKHGKRKRWLNDDLQLAAQAMCLEEIFGKPVSKGAIYHQQSRRRREVVIDDVLRQTVETTSRAVRQLLICRKLPRPVDDPRRCPECSLREICQPELARAGGKIATLAARIYFQSMRYLIRTSVRENFPFDGRSRRPPMDPMNALLSFVYAVVLNDCRSALEVVGLDPQLGFLHAVRPGRMALALDLLEEFRSVIADRLALTLVNRGQIQATHFDRREGGAVLLNDEGRKTVITSYQERKHETVAHPILDQQISIGLLPHQQARLLARYLRGDAPAYVPYLHR